MYHSCEITGTGTISPKDIVRIPARARRLRPWRNTVAIAYLLHDRNQTIPFGLTVPYP